MRLEIFDVEQGTREWFLCSLRCPDCLCFHKMLAKGRGDAESKTRADYLSQLADEVGLPGSGRVLHQRRTWSAAR